jgi:hypothetical protein
MEHITSNPAFPYALSVLAFVYIVGYIYSVRTKCVIIAGQSDFIFLVIPWVTGLINVFFRKENPSAPLSTISIVSLIVFGVLPLLVSFVLSFANNKVFFHAFVSILTKITIFILIPIVFILFIMASMSGKKNGRFKDGTQNNEKTANIGLAVAISALLIGALIKDVDLA